MVTTRKRAAVKPKAPTTKPTPKSKAAAKISKQETVDNTYHDVSYCDNNMMDLSTDDDYHGYSTNHVFNSKYSVPTSKPSPVVDDGKIAVLIDKFGDKMIELSKTRDVESAETCKSKDAMIADSMKSRDAMLADSIKTKDAMFMEMMKNMSAALQTVSSLTDKVSEGSKAAQENSKALASQLVSTINKISEDSRKTLEDSRNHDKAMAQLRFTETMHNTYLSSIVQLNKDKDSDTAFGIAGPEFGFSVNKA